MMHREYRAERAVSPTDGSVSWVVIDAEYALHTQACAFLAGLRGRDLSVNTERVYAGRVALLLSWCAAEGADWTQARLDQLVRFKRWLVTEPLPSRRRGVSGSLRWRSNATADAVLGTVCEFYRFCARHDLADAELVKRLYEPRYLRFLPAGYDSGEDEEFRTVRSRVLKFSVAESMFEFLEPGQIEPLVVAAGNPRDRFLVVLLALTGARIGEVLGLHREDMHLLADSRMLGCPLAGPHLHVRRRTDNPNGALAKSRFPRSIPVPDRAVTFYCEYLHERGRLLADPDASPMVFVNLYRQPVGVPLGYPNAKDMFDRLARRTGLTVRPHLLRHTAATTWLHEGAARDTVQNLLGHVSPSSMQLYLHPDEGAKRAAVEHAAQSCLGTR